MDWVTDFVILSFMASAFAIVLSSANFLADKILEGKTVDKDGRLVWRKGSDMVAKEEKTKGQ